MKKERDYNQENDPEFDGQAQNDNVNEEMDQQNGGEEERSARPSRKGRKVKPRRERAYAGDFEDNGDEENMEDENEGREEEYDEDEDVTNVERIGKKVLNYIKENTRDIDKEEMLKYAAIGALAIYGISRSSFLRSILISTAVGVVAKHWLQEQEEEEEQPAAA